MYEVFRSEFEPRMDAKGRVSVPAEFIRVLKSGDPTTSADRPRPSMVLVHAGNRPCLQGHTMLSIARITRAIERMPNAHPDKSVLQRAYGAKAIQIEVGDDSRIVLSPKVRAYLGLADVKDGAEIVFVGRIDKFEIWNREAYEAEAAAQDALLLSRIPAGADVSALLPDLAYED